MFMDATLIYQAIMKEKKEVDKQVMYQLPNNLEILSHANTRGWNFWFYNFKTKIVLQLWCHIKFGPQFVVIPEKFSCIFNEKLGVF